MEQTTPLAVQLELGLSYEDKKLSVKMVRDFVEASQTAPIADGRRGRVNSYALFILIATHIYGACEMGDGEEAGTAAMITLSELFGESFVYALVEYDNSSSKELKGILKGLGIDGPDND
jgi:hypothetical protein